MRKQILTFGIITGGILMPVMYVLMNMARKSANVDISTILVYAAVVLLFITVFAGIKSYRDRAQGGFITFGKAFKVGILISLATLLSYIVAWLILYKPIFKDFMEQHAAALMEKLQASGASVEEIATKKEKMQQQAGLYENPFTRSAILLVQGFPLQVIMTVIASFILKKKSGEV